MRDSDRSLPSLETEFQCYALVQDIESLYQELQIMTVDYGKAISSVSGAINSIKTLADLAVQSHALDLKEGLLNLREEMLEIKTALIEAKEENIELKQKISEITKQNKPKLEYRNGFYYKDDKPDPFCPNCYENGKTTILSIAKLPGDRYRCSACGWSKL